MGIVDQLKTKSNRFIVIVQDWSGLGWLKMLADEGKEVLAVYGQKEGDDDPEGNFDCVGDGMCDKMPIEEFMKKRAQYKDAYIIFDGNHHPDESEKLRKEGFQRVFGGQKFADDSEHDRAFGLSLVKKAGLQTPPDHKFQDINEAIAFMEQNEEKAYVFKPDEPDEHAWKTTVPDSEKDNEANEEIRKFLDSFGTASSSFVLQERKSGVEINVEVWLYKGQPIFSHANFECKKKYNKDLGSLVGCAQDIEFTVPLDCKVISETLLKLIKLPEYKDFTGFADMNIICGDNAYWFLEFCNRFGYNSHPNLFLNLAITPFGEIMKKFIDGDIDNFADNFRQGFGASITMLIDNPVNGLPLIIPEDVDHKFFHFDSYKDVDDYRLSGYSSEVGIICGMDYDLKSAADEVLKNLNKIRFPSRAGRTDINLTDYFTNPYERWIAANAMKLFDRK